MSAEIQRMPFVVGSMWEMRRKKMERLPPEAALLVDLCVAIPKLRTLTAAEDRKFKSLVAAAFQKIREEKQESHE
jgi:hypothetical protein